MLLMPIFALASAALLVQMPPRPEGRRAASPAGFVAFSADLKITNPKRPDAFGRHLQDEHGCMRRETVYPDGAPMIMIMNFETQKMYRLGRSWTVQPMRVGPAPRRPRTMPVIRQLQQIEGFETWTSTIRLANSPTGETSRELVVIPALNFFEPLVKHPNGDTITAHNIRVGPVDHSEFLPPPSVVPVEVDDPAGSLSFQAVAIRIDFPKKVSLLETIEETPMPFETPGQEALWVVTTVTDAAKGVVRVRVMKNAKRVRPGVVSGDVLDELQIGLGDTASTRKLAENFAVTINRIGTRTAR